MNMNVFRKEIRMNRRSFLTWTVIAVLVVIIYLPFFPYMQGPGYRDLIQDFPEAIRDAFNIHNIIFTEINYYHAGLVMPYVLILAGIYAAMLAGRLISRESDLNTAEFLFTKPVTRNQILAAKTAAFLFFNFALWAAIYAAAAVTGILTAPGEFDVVLQLPVHLAGFLAALAAGGIAFAAAPFINQVSGTTSLGVGLGLGFFILDAASRMTEKLAFLQYLNTFYYAGFEDAAAGNPFTAGLLVLLLVFLLGTGLGFLFLNRKEFTA